MRGNYVIVFCLRVRYSKIGMAICNPYKRFVKNTRRYIRNASNRSFHRGNIIRHVEFGAGLLFHLIEFDAGGEFGQS